MDKQQTYNNFHQPSVACNKSVKSCKTCAYVEYFEKRPDEISNMGCTKPGFEGYTREDRMECGGVFYVPSRKE